MSNVDLKALDWSTLLLIIALGTTVKFFFYSVGYSIKKHREAQASEADKKQA